MSDHSNDWVGQTLSGGRYRVDAKLGEGGMGYVYKVWDRNLDTDVVIKVPRRSMLDDPEFASRFALEIRSLVKLSHPNIVKVSDVGEHEGVTFAVMQYLSGGTLDAAWAQGHPEKIVDFGWRAIHETAAASKAIVEAYYAKAPAHSYFSGSLSRNE